MEYITRKEIQELLNRENVSSAFYAVRKLEPVKKEVVNGRYTKFWDRAEVLKLIGEILSKRESDGKKSRGIFNEPK